MTKWKRTVALSVAMLICSSELGWAAEPINFAPADTQALVELLKSCDGALNASQAAHEKKDALITSQQTLISRQAAELSEVKSPGILDNKVLWFAAGILVTGLTVRLVRP